MSLKFIANGSHGVPHGPRRTIHYSAGGGGSRGAYDFDAVGRIPIRRRIMTWETGPLPVCRRLTLGFHANVNFIVMISIHLLLLTKIYIHRFSFARFGPEIWGAGFRIVVLPFQVPSVVGPDVVRDSYSHRNGNCSRS